MKIRYHISFSRTLAATALLAMSAMASAAESVSESGASSASATATGTSSASASSDDSSAEGYAINWSASLLMNAGSGDFAPYYIASNRHGVLTQSSNALARIDAWRPHEEGKRFTYSFGVDALGGYSSSVDYMRFQDAAADAAVPAGGLAVKNGLLVPHAEHPARVWLQQLYGELRYRGVFLTVGMKEHTSALLSSTLSSGDLVESGNARPIPEVRAGFHDFQNIPFTNGWVQIQGEISYGKPMDNKWLRNHYNYYYGHLNQGEFYSYKRCYFRTKPSQPFSVTVGMQVGAFFGGTTNWYTDGKYIRTRSYSRGIKQFFKMLVPTDGSTLAYYSGSSLGCWDLHLRYRLPSGASVKAYMQKPWEDGSGIGCLNGFDGVWGLQYTAPQPGLISGAVIEYIDFTNQSGPMHWDPDDNPGTTITHRAEGADDYYYNHEYNPYAYYGMAIGTPFMVSPIYNTDGNMVFAYNRMRGFHIGVKGVITPELSYRVLGGYRRSWGRYRDPLPEPRSDTSFMLEAGYSPRKVAGLTVLAQFALDHGTLLGNNTGGMITVRFSDVLRIGGRRKYPGILHPTEKTCL